MPIEVDSRGDPAVREMNILTTKEIFLGLKILLRYELKLADIFVEKIN